MRIHTFHRLGLILVFTLFAGCASVGPTADPAVYNSTDLGTLQREYARASKISQFNWTMGMLLNDKRVGKGAYLEYLSQRIKDAEARNDAAAAGLAEAAETMRRQAEERAALEAAMPKPPKGKIQCGSTLVAYLMYHEGCTKPGMEAVPIKAGCVVKLDGYVIARQKISEGYLITGNYNLLSTSDPSMCPLAFEPAILETSMEISRGGSPSGFAEYVGATSYTAVDGFPKTVMRFKEVQSEK